MNSSFPVTTETDWSYAFRAREALVEADVLLRGDVSPYFASCEQFCGMSLDGLVKIVEDMKGSIPHKPIFNSLDVPNVQSHDKGHRKQVWGILSNTMDEVIPYPLGSTEQKADIISHWISSSRVYMAYMKLEADFLANLKKYGILGVTVFETEKILSSEQKFSEVMSLSQRFNQENREFLVKFVAMAAHRLDVHFHAINRRII